MCIKSRADALANLPSRARWFPQGDAAIRQRNGSYESSALLGQTDGEFFMSRTSKHSVPAGSWTPGGSEFIGAWRRYIGIDHLDEALYLIRGDEKDTLQPVATYGDRAIGGDRA